MKSFYLKEGAFLFLLCLFSEISSAQVLLKKLNVSGESVAFNGWMYFAADDGVHGQELWKTNGTAEGTILVKDIWSGEKGSRPSKFMVHEDWLYFNADNSQYGMEIWRTNGTPEGTELFLDFRPGTDDFYINSWTVHDESLIVTEAQGYSVPFYVLDPENQSMSCLQPGCEKNWGNNLFTFQQQLYIEYPLALYNEESEHFKEIDLPDYEDVQKVFPGNQEIYIVDGRYYGNQKKLGVYIPATDTLITLESWSTDTYGEVEIGDMMQVGELLFFSVRLDYDNDDDKDQLWVSDGTVEGTRLLASFPWNSHSYNDEMLNFAEAGRKLYFVGNESAGGGIWTSDGTEEGTKLVFAGNIVKKSRDGDRENPLSSWNDKLYFQSDYRYFSILHPDDGNISYVFKEVLEGLRFLGGAGEDYFFADKNGLWSDRQNPRIQLNVSAINFESFKIDSCASKLIRLSNLGRKALYFSDISITGFSFYLKDSFPATLAPGAYADLEIFFFPDTAGRHDGKVSVWSNDRTSPVVDIILRATVSEEEGKCETEIEGSKRLLFQQPNQAIRLSNTLLKENSSADIEVGSLTVPDRSGEFSYSLVSGEGDRDNAYFSISGNKLVLNKSFDFELDNILSLRVRAEGEETFENTFLVFLEDLQETAVEATCGEYLVHMDQALRHVTFLDEQKVMAVGDRGVILLAKDGGNTWKDISPRVLDDFHHVVFPQTDTGFVLGKRHILRTYNGGEEWQVLQLPDFNGELVGLSFSTVQKGNFVTSSGEVFITDSRGDQWSFVSGISESISTSFFLDSLTGWMGSENSKLFSTQDGGKSWNTLPLNGITTLSKLKQIQAFDTLKMFILTAQGAIYKSTNGGKNWVGITSGLSDINSMQMMSPDLGYIFRENAGVYKTEDGGVQWEEQFSSRGRVWSIAANNSFSSVVMVGESEGFYSTTRPHKLIIIGASDHWHLASYFDMDDLLYPQWIKEGQGIALARGYSYIPTFYSTYDGGLTWQPFPTPYINYAHGFSFLNLERGIIATDDALLKTADGGKNWESISNQWGIREIKYITEDMLYAVSLSNVLKSGDGGSSWDTLQVSVPSSGGGMKLHFENELLGFVWSAGFYRTEDGGENWEKVLDDYPLITEIYFISDLVGYIKMYEGEIFKTDDGGKSWQVIQQENNDDAAMTPLFLDELNAYGTVHGKVYMSNDGGHNWYEKFNVDGRDLRLSNNGRGEILIYSRGDGSFGNENVLVRIAGEMTPTLPGNIAGSTEAVPGNPYRYKAAGLKHLSYYWAVRGGKIIRYADNEVVVLWDKGQDKSISLQVNTSCGQQRQLELRVEEIQERDFSIEEEPQEEPQEPITGINDSSESTKVSIYPNPTTDIVSLNIEKLELRSSHIQIVTSSGKIVRSEKLELSKDVNDTRLAVDLSALPNGLYIINILSEHETLSFRIIKK